MSAETVERSLFNWNLRQRDPLVGVLVNEQGLRSAFEQHKLDALIASNPKTFTYVSNFECLGHQWIDRAVCLAVLPSSAAGKKTLVFPHFELDQYEESGQWNGSIRCYEFFFMFDSDGPFSDYEARVRALRAEVPCHANAVEAVVEGIKDARAATGCVGIETRGLKQTFLRQLEAALPECTFVEADEIWRVIAMKKTAREIELIRKAAAINGQAMVDTARRIDVGMPEEELSFYFKQRIFELGADVTFAIIKGGGESSLVHMPPSKYRLREGDVVRFDVGCIYSRYHADMGRTYAVGRASRRHRETYDALRAGQDAVFEIAAPGVKPRDLLSAAVEAVRRAGMPSYNRSFIGHGVGAELYDLPLLTASDTPVLEEGMCMNIEMGYYHLGFSGFQLEDPICITSSGAEVLSTIGRQLELI